MPDFFCNDPLLIMSPISSKLFSYIPYFTFNKNQVFFFHKYFCSDKIFNIWKKCEAFDRDSSLLKPNKTEFHARVFASA